MTTERLPAGWEAVPATLLGPSLTSGLYGAFLGAVLASFYGVVDDRVPRGEGLGGRSHCACGRRLAVHENIPVLGWLACAGRARCCGSRLPARYLVTETVAAAAAGFVGWRFGLLAAAVALTMWGVLTFARARRRRKETTR